MKISLCRKLATAFLPVFLSLVCMRAGAQTNLVVNGEFQDGANGTNGWTFSIPPQGSYNITGAIDGYPGFVAINAGFPGIAMSQALVTVPGTYYHVTFSGLFNSPPPTASPLPAATVDFGGVPLSYIYTNKASVQSCDFIVQASQTNTVLTFTCGTSATWVQTLGHISVVPVTLFNVQPTNQAVMLSSNAQFAVTVSSATPLSYQWYFNNAPLGGQTNTVLAINGAALTDQGNYSVILTNGYGSITSAVATLAVSVPVNLITNGDFPDGTNRWGFSYDHNAGTAVIFTTMYPGYATVAGTTVSPVLGQAVATVPGAYYQVSFSYFSRSAPGTIIPRLGCTFGGISLATTLTNADVPVTKIYIVQASQTNSLLNFTFETDPNWNQDVGLIKVAPVDAFALQPPHQVVALSSNASISASAIGADPLTYTWYFETNLVAGQTGPTFTLNNFSITNQGNYHVIVSDSYGSITSQVATVLALQTNLVNNGTFQAGVNGADGWTFYYDQGAGNAYFNGGSVSGTGPGATVSQNLNTVPGAFYKVSLDYKMTLPAYLSPQGLTFKLGGAFLNFAYTNSDGPLNKFNHYDFIVQADRTNATLLFSFGTDANWAQTIDNVSVTPVASFNLQPANQIVVLSSNALFTATVNGAATFSYAWYLNNALLFGQTGAAFSLANVSGTNQGGYFVVLANSYGSITSALAGLTVVLPAQAFTSTLTNGNQLSLKLAGNPGQVFAVLAATNLLPPIQWQPVATNSADLNGQWNLVITNRASPRFYRAVGQ